MRTSQENLVADKKSRMLQFRAEAEAASDLQEREINPSDRTAFYLRQLQTATSYLVTVATAIGTGRPQVDFDDCGLQFFAGADVTIARAEAEHALQQQDEQWRRLWDLLKAAIGSFQRWAGDADKGIQLAKVIFVTAFVLRGVYESGLEYGVSDQERGFEVYASEVPVPIERTMPLAEQVEIVSKNLEWLGEQMRYGVVWPRWW